VSTLLFLCYSLITQVPILILPDVFAANCSTTWITSVADADVLRRNCRVVMGHIGIGPFVGDSTVHINLDGIEVITGTLGEYPFSRTDYVTQPFYTLSSSSLKRVDAVEFGHYDTKVVNLTLPSLRSVNDYFEVGQYAYDLTYLDITSLDTAPTIHLSSPNLTTLHHTRLRNVTDLSIYPMQIDSLKSLIDNQLNLRNAIIQGPFPNVNNISIGFASAKYLNINDNSSVTLGGSSTTEMAIEQLKLSGGVTDLNRSAQVNTLEVDSLELSNSVSITHLEIPFDNLRSLKVLQRFETHPLKSLTLPPQALNWIGGFQLKIESAPDLNLTSIYGVDGQGNGMQTWYWPRNVTLIDIIDVTIANAFLYVHLPPSQPQSGHKSLPRRTAIHLSPSKRPRWIVNFLLQS
jgi:hypothetical protein